MAELTGAPGDRRAYAGNIRRYYLFTATTGFVLWQPVWVIFFQGRGLSLSQIGLLETLTTVLLAVSEVPTGVVADIWGRKASMATGALLHGVAVLGVLTKVLSPVFLVSYAAWGVSFSFITGSGEAFAFDTLRVQGRVGAFVHVASRQAMTRRAASGLSGLAGGLIGAYNLSLCFVLTSVCCLTGAVIILTGHEPPGDPVTDSQGDGYWATLRSGVASAARNARVRYLLLTAALVEVVATILTITAFQPYATEVGMPIWSFGVILLAMQVCGVGGAYLAGRVAGNRVRMLTAVLLAVAGCLIALWLGASPPAIGFFAVAIGLAALAQPVLSVMLNEQIASRQRATVLSLQSLVAMLGFGLPSW